MSNTRIRKPRKDIVNDPNEPSFLDQAPDVQRTIVAAADEKNDYFSPAATDVMQCLSNTGTTLHGFFKQELDQRAAKQAQKLLIHVLQGKAVQVLEMAKTSPRLFFIKATAEDYARDLADNERTIERWSPYQAMFGTGDKDMLKAVKSYLDAYLDTIPDGRKMAAEQEQEKFPDGFDYPPSTDEFNQLINDLAEAITNDTQLRTNWKNPSPATQVLLTKLREHYKPGIVKTGHHFNLSDLIKTDEICYQKWSSNSWNWAQLTFFSVMAEGLQQRLLTAFQLQVACMGLDNYLNKNQPLIRNVEVMNYVTGKKITVAPFTSEDPLCRLGEGFVLDSYYGRGGATVWLFRTPRLLESYVKQSQQSFRDLCTHQRNKRIRAV